MSSTRPNFVDHRLVQVQTPQEVGEEAARHIYSAIRSTLTKTSQCVIGCPGGRSPITTYRALAQMVGEAQLPLDHVVIAMMDEYLVGESATEVKNADPRMHYSCKGFARKHIVEVLNASAPEGRGISPENLWVPNCAEPEEYETRLRKHGVDVFLLAVGASDGHVAFNPAGTSLDAETRVTPLARLTREDNMHTFPEFLSIEEVPKFGVSVGPATIKDVSKEAVLVVHGAHKAPALKRLMQVDRYDPSWPASVIWECRNPVVIADEAASALL